MSETQTAPSGSAYPQTAQDTKGPRMIHDHLPPQSQTPPQPLKTYTSQTPLLSSSPFVYQSQSLSQPQPQFQPRPQSPLTRPLVYHYQNPRTGETIASLLPPNHPEMVCLQEGHHKTGPTQWGIVGLLSAIVFFPLGVALCLVDRKVTCRRCGYVIHHGLST